MAIGNRLNHHRDISVVLFALMVSATSGAVISSSGGGVTALILFATLVPFALSVVVVAPQALFWVLLLSAMFGRFVFATDAGHLRLDQLAVVPLFFLVALHALRVRPMQRRTRSTTIVVMLLVIYIASNLVSSWNSSESFGDSFSIIIWLSLSLLSLITARVLLYTTVSSIDAIGIVLWGGVGVSIVGIGLWIANILGFPSFAIEVSTIAGRFTRVALRSTFLEPNILGSFLAFCLCVLFVLWQEKVKGGAILVHAWIPGAVMLLALLLTLTRAAWISLVIGILAYLAIRKRDHTNRRSLNSLAVLASILLAALTPTSFGSVLVHRIASIANDPTRTLNYRTRTVIDAITQWQDSPWFGYGTNSYVQRNFEESTRMGYLPSWFPATLYDSGLLGFLPLAAALGYLLIRLTRAMRSASPVADSGYHSAISAALLAGIVSLLVSYQSTNAFWFSYNWVIIAIALATIDASNSPDRTEALAVKQGALTAPNIPKEN